MGNPSAAGLHERPGAGGLCQKKAACGLRRGLRRPERAGAALTPTEYRLLCLLSRNAGEVLTHTFVTQNIWGRSWDNDAAHLRVFIAMFRKKLNPTPDSPQYIQTHIGVGYRMVKVEKS